MVARRLEVEELFWNFNGGECKEGWERKKRATRDAPASSRSRTFLPSPPQGALTQSRMGLSVKDWESGEGGTVQEKGTERFFSWRLVTTTTTLLAMAERERSAPQDNQSTPSGTARLLLLQE